MARTRQPVQDVNSGADGEALLDQVATLTELPKDMIWDELKGIVQNSGHDTKNVTLEELRLALIEHLEAMNADILSNLSDDGSQSDDGE